MEVGVSSRNLLILSLILRGIKEKIFFRMVVGSHESLEDYEERFQLNYRSANCTLDPKSLKLVLH